MFFTNEQNAKIEKAKQNKTKSPTSQINCQLSVFEGASFNPAFLFTPLIEGVLLK